MYIRTVLAALNRELRLGRAEFGSTSIYLVLFAATVSKPTTVGLASVHLSLPPTNMSRHSKLYVPILITGMLVTGSSNSLWSKFQVR